VVGPGKALSRAGSEERHRRPLEPRGGPAGARERRLRGRRFGRDAGQGSAVAAESRHGDRQDADGTAHRHDTSRMVRVMSEDARGVKREYNTLSHGITAGTRISLEVKGESR
jgi:hypothetical protein